VEDDLNASEESPPRSPRALLTEGAVIVVSILLAFAVDAAWDRHLQRQQFEEDLEQVREQLVVDLDGLNGAIEDSESALERLDMFMGLSPSALAALEPDSIEYALNGLRLRGIYDQSGLSVEAFVRDGRVSLVDDPLARVLIRIWSSLEEELSEDFAAVVATDPLIQQVTATHGIMAARVGRSRSIPGARSLADAAFDLRADPMALDIAAQRRLSVQSYLRNLVTYRDRLFFTLLDILGEPAAAQLDQGE
jgi:hypothetical protein